MEDLHIHEFPVLRDPPMIVGLTGWMDVGRVSTGTVEYLADGLDAGSLAEMNPLDFYILNFPVTTIPVTVYVEGGKTHVSTIDPMDFAAMFRPATEITDGVVQNITLPANTFTFSRDPDLIYFRGEEPHIRWGSYIDCILRVAEEFGTRNLLFVGSVASPVPHTRKPRVRCSAPTAEMRDALRGPGVLSTDYAGPCSVITVLGEQAAARGLSFGSVVVEVPHYPFLEMPGYPASIAVAVETLGKVLGVNVDMTPLEGDIERTNIQLNEIMADNEEFQELVDHLESSYDLEQSTADDELLKRLIEGMNMGGNNDSDTN